MSTTAIDAEVRSYLSAVKANLKNLPEEERDDLLEDLEQHLAEVSAEGDGTLVERLGPPDVYAAELRSSVGIPPVTTSLVARLVAGLDDTTVVRWFRTFLPELRPGWWVLRGVMAAVGFVLLGMDSSTYFDLSKFAFLTAGASLFGVWLSVLLGRRSASSLGMRVLSVGANIGVVVLALAGLSSAYNAHMSLWYQTADYQAQDMSGEAYLTHPDGEPIVDICPYDAQGKPLKNVMLFDEHGRPIINVSPFDGQYRRIPLSGDNIYPRRLTIIDPETGKEKPFGCLSVIVTQESPTTEQVPPPAQPVP